MISEERKVPLLWSLLSDGKTEQQIAPSDGSATHKKHAPRPVLRPGVPVVVSGEGWFLRMCRQEERLQIDVKKSHFCQGSPSYLYPRARSPFLQQHVNSEKSPVNERL